MYEGAHFHSNLITLQETNEINLALTARNLYGRVHFSVHVYDPSQNSHYRPLAFGIPFQNDWSVFNTTLTLPSSELPTDKPVSICLYTETLGEDPHGIQIQRFELYENGATNQLVDDCRSPITEDPGYCSVTTSTTESSVSETIENTESTSVSETTIVSSTLNNTEAHSSYSTGYELSTESSSVTNFQSSTVSVLTTHSVLSTDITTGTEMHTVPSLTSELSSTVDPTKETSTVKTTVSTSLVVTTPVSSTISSNYTIEGGSTKTTNNMSSVITTTGTLPTFSTLPNASDITSDPLSTTETISTEATTPNFSDFVTTPELILFLIMTILLSVIVLILLFILCILLRRRRKIKEQPKAYIEAAQVTPTPLVDFSIKDNDLLYKETFYENQIDIVSEGSSPNPIPIIDREYQNKRLSYPLMGTAIKRVPMESFRTGYDYDEQAPRLRMAKSTQEVLLV
ncbi:hypothetical protein QYM36_015053 [Artemia franciscana]|nr:hypothetical protein QYM36_015053 [Artemia franciscana]